MRYKIYKLQDDGGLMRRPWKVRADGNAMNLCCKTWDEAINAAIEHATESWIDSLYDWHRHGTIENFNFRERC